ncbi:MAG: aminotransferase class IV [Planctomycetota bacterium]
MSELVWINGKMLPRDEARVSAFDAAFQHGVGLFETMLATSGRVFRLDRHLARLEASARTLGLTERLSTSALAEAVEHVTKESGLAEGEGRARVRLTLTGGDLNMLAREQRGPSDPTIVIQVTHATRYPDEMMERGVSCVVADAKANPLDPFAAHKTLNYWWRLRELQNASAKGAGEALVLQVTNHVCGGSVSSIFCVQDGTLRVPIARGEEVDGGVPSPVLPGVTRDAIIEFADAMGVGCERTMLTVADVLDADEVFVTNASWGVLPVVKMEAKAIADGAPGALTKDLRQKWLDAIRDEA